MGQDWLSRQWEAKGEPDEPLDSVVACAVDFKRLYPEDTKVRDAVMAWTMKAPTWEEAIDRACRSRGEDGKMDNHQSRVPLNNLLEFRNRIGADPDLAELAIYDFDDLHDALEQVRPAGIGPVTTYDVAVRLACWIGIEPTSLYLHAGVAKGAKALGLPVRGRKRVPYDELERHLGQEVLDVIGDVTTLEDFSCCYRRVFEGMNEHDPGSEGEDQPWDDV